MNLIELADLLEQAAKALRDHESQISEVIPPRSTPINEVPGWRDLSVRARRVFRKYHHRDSFNCKSYPYPIDTFEKLLSLSPEELMETQGCGPTTCNEICKWVESHNKSLRNVVLNEV